MSALILGILLPFGDAPFCVISSAGKACIYYNLNACQAAARRMQGMCMPK